MFERFTRRRFTVGETTINGEIGGSGPPLLLLHGFPETHVMWHKIAPALAERFTVVATDLRGYGDSAKPPSDPDHATYSKRATAQDQVEVMAALGFSTFAVAGHDRGGRVAHRLALDHPDRVSRLAVLDIVPTHKIFSTVNKAIATGYYHWFFLIQPSPLPETLIGHDAEFFLMEKLKQWSGNFAAFDVDALAEYIRCFSDPDAIRGACEDYRAAASIDLVHDEADMDRKVTCPLLVLWGQRGLMERHYDVLATWRERADDVRGRMLACGHFLPEEAPEETLAELTAFFAS
jgi:haloacetate dehalogenase